MTGKDSKWEFSCPQFVDFSVNPNEYEDKADEWFDKIPFGDGSLRFDDSGVKVDEKSKGVSNVGEMSVPTAKSRFSSSSSLQSPSMGTVTKKLRLSTTVKKSLPLRRSSRRLSSHHVLRNRFSARLARDSHPIVKKRRDSKVGVKKVKEVDFVASLRRYDDPKTTEAKCTGHVTVPVPFKLSSNREKVGVAKFRSIAEQVAAFHKQTPDRFRTAKKIEEKAGDVLISVVARKPPKTPQLLTSLRSRPTVVVGNDEKERLEAEEMKKFQFHANPLNPSILEKADELPKVETKANTVVHPFNLRSTNRATCTVTSQTEGVVPIFTARPVPKGLFENPKVGAVSRRDVTEPKSPAFFLKNRASHWQDIETHRNEREVRDSTRAKRIATPVFSEPFLPKLEHRKTVVEPFNFEERDSERHQRKEEKMKLIFEQEKQMREFHAQPLPDPAIKGLPVKQPIAGTKLEPFRLSADDRGKMKQMKWIEQMEQDLKDQRAKLQFKAQPCKMIYENPFVPERVTRPLTDKSNFELETEKRAKERRVFDEMLKEKDARNEEIIREREERRLEEERIEVENIRRNAVHRAQPVRRYKEVNFEGSNIPLTNPLSPNFATKKRKRQT